LEIEEAFSRFEKAHYDYVTKIGARNTQLRWNPNAQEFTSCSVGPTVPVSHPGATNPTLPGGIMDKTALTIKQDLHCQKRN